MYLLFPDIIFLANAGWPKLKLRLEIASTAKLISLSICFQLIFNKFGGLYLFF